MRISLVLALMVASIVMAGCEQVDSQVLNGVREYFPAAELSKPGQNQLQLTTHLSNISEKFARTLMQMQLQQHQQELRIFFPLSGYTTLLVDFEEVQCAWFTTQPDTFICSVKPIRQGTVHRYPISGF